MLRASNDPLIACSNPRVFIGLCKQRSLCVLIKAHITRKKIDLLRSFFLHYVRASARSALQYFIWLNSKTVKIYSIVKTVNLLEVY